MGFIKVPRALLKIGELCATDAIALSYVNWRWFDPHGGHDVDARELEQLSGWAHSTAWRALERLTAAGWLERTATGREGRYAPLRPMPTPPDERSGERVHAPGAGLPAGFLRVQWSHVRELGELEGCTLQVLRGLGGRYKEVFRTDAEGLNGQPAGDLASTLGICRDTARAVLERLAKGDTRRHRLTLRRGSVAKLAPYILLRKRIGAPTRLRELNERERASKATQAKPAVVKATTTTHRVATPEEVAAVAAALWASKGMRGPPPMPPS